MSNKTLTALPLTAAGYAPYGDVIQARTDAKDITGANQGTAEKYHWTASIVNNHPNNGGKSNMCVFHCRPTKELPFKCKILERHPYSSQAFVPMNAGNTRGYLVIVALNGEDDKPDMSTLKAFICSNVQGVNYAAGIWHHPMIALEAETDFACLVHESGINEDDCQVVSVEEWIVDVPGYTA
ncbi:hypothetical protein INT44_008677 [Umbelopsis vinacea]|uniref:Ureidoglycolate hydrolase n=1 Tax=Umbelopsis vinacea TaxID=44442 RepID=A0A8H7PZ89_9FUNG|nr:hypothetical protein INT44_008677 [Umbelopsis vinacea]